MREEKFNSAKPGYESDDIKYAFEYNNLSDKLGMIDVIVAEVCGENDGVNWYWILLMRDGTFSCAEGGCDYTGWDCQSHASVKEGFKTPTEAIEALDIWEYDHRKNIRVCLTKQINDELPFAIYQD